MPFTRERSLTATVMRLASTLPMCHTPVKPNNAMDAEASIRGTTVYLVDKRIDMLPMLLGTDLCSLKPHARTLCLLGDLGDELVRRHCRLALYEIGHQISRSLQLRRSTTQSR